MRKDISAGNSTKQENKKIWDAAACKKMFGHSGGKNASGNDPEMALKFGIYRKKKLW